MSLADLIPTSFAQLGSICLGLAVVLVLVDMPGGVNWSKVAGWFALFGGAGVLGGAGGWLGQHIISTSASAMSFAQKWAAGAIGGGALVVVLFGVGFWAYSHLSGKGVEAGGKGKWAKKVRSLLKAGAIALIGAAIVAAIPPLYTGGDWVIGALGGGLRHAAGSVL